MKLSKPQRIIYNMEKFSGGAVAVVCGSVLYEGKADIIQLKKAVNELYRINEALRYKIVEKNGIVSQEVCEYQEREIQVLKFETEKELRSYGEEYAKKQMSIYDNLANISLICMKDAYGLMFKMHHIISDAWTIAILSNQFLEIMAGKTPKAKPYSAYIAFEEKYETTRHYAEDKEYWHDILHNCSESTLIKNTSQENAAAIRKTFKIDTDMTLKLKQFAESCGSSLYNVMFTAIAVYVNRISNNTENFYLGTAVLNRATLAEKSTAGMYINTVPMPITLKNEESFEENLEIMKENITTSFRHQKYNYTDILADVRSIYGSEERLFDVTFNYQNVTMNIGNEKTKSDWYHCGKQIENLQIHVDDRDKEGSLTIHYDYKVNVFSEKEIHSIHEHLMNILCSVMKNKHQKICQINMMSDLEKNILIHSQPEIKHSLCNQTIHGVFESEVEKHPNQTAVIAADRTLTYQELNIEANKIANSLIKKGVKLNDIVAFRLRRTSHIPAVMLGILKAGGAYLPVDYKLPEDRITYMLSDSKAKCYIEDKSLEWLLQGEETSPSVSVSGDDLSYCIYTSGSTGNPKGVLIRHRNLLNFCDNDNNENNYYTATINKGSRILASFNVCFDAFGVDSWLFLLNGKSMVFTNEEQMTNAEMLAELIEKEHADVIHTTPTIITSHMNNKKFQHAMKHLKVMLIAAEAFLPELYLKLKNYTDAEIYNGYGPSETTIGITIGRVNDENITIGKPISNTQIYIVDQYMNIVPQGITGELCVAGNSVGAGYLNRPELTNEKFVNNPFGKGKLYKTGDMAYWREDGRITYVGRNDFQVKIRGLRVELGEIENMIAAGENISQAVVVVRKDDTGKQIICAFYTENGAANLDEIRKNIAKKLPRYMMPQIFERLEEMPLTSGGKIDRKRLPKLDLNNLTSEDEYVEPITVMEKKIVGLWEKILKISPIGVCTSFFDAGGDSLNAIEFVTLAHDTGIYLDAQDVFDYPTIRELCEYIQKTYKNDMKEENYCGSHNMIEENSTHFDDIIKNNTLEHLNSTKSSVNKDFTGQSIENIFLTGVTGYLGIHILKEYLESYSGTAYCLVRGSNLEDAKKHFETEFLYYFDAETLKKYHSRIVIVKGDITQKNLGMSESDIPNCKLTVIHSAATVKHYGNYAEFEKINVNGTEHALNFAKQVNAKFIYISTLSVSGFYAKQPVCYQENMFYVQQDLSNVYLRSKFEAEKRVFESAAEGMEAAICRMGNLMNRSSDGLFQKNYETNAFIKRIRAFIYMGKFPDYAKDVKVDMTPIDEAAKAVLCIAAHFDKNHNVFHINNTNTVSIGNLIETIAKLGREIAIVDGDSFEEDIRNLQDKTAIEALIHELDQNNHLHLHGNVTTSSDYTEQFLKQYGFVWGKIDEKYLKKWYHFFNTHTF